MGRDKGENLGIDLVKKSNTNSSFVERVAKSSREGGMGESEMVVVAKSQRCRAKPIAQSHALSVSGSASVCRIAISSHGAAAAVGPERARVVLRQRNFRSSLSPFLLARWLLPARLATGFFKLLFPRLLRLYLHGLADHLRALMTVDRANISEVTRFGCE